MLLKPFEVFSHAQRTQPVDKEIRGRGGAIRETSYGKETITPEGALSVTAVLAAFTILAEDLSSLPLILYARRGRDKYRAYDELNYRLLHDAPNPEMSSMIFRELMMGHLLAWGNFYGQLIFSGRGRIEEIWPLRPDRMRVERKGGEKLYIYRTSEGKERLFTRDEILHIPAFGFDGLIGYSRIALARNAIGLSIAAEKFGSTFFSNGAQPGVALKYPKTLSPEAHKNLRDSWIEDHQGAEKHGGVAILEEGMDIATIGIPPEDAQFLETRKFQVAEIARIFRVPPHMIGDVERTTSWGSGIDSQEQGYVNHTLRPWGVRIEQCLDQQILLPSERDRGMYFEHLYEALLRGDLKTRYEAYVQAINNGFMTPNEVRAKENMNSYPGGDEFRRPANILPADAPAPRADALELHARSEKRESSSSLPMPRIERSFQRMLLDTASRFLRREANDLRGAARKFLAKQDKAGFESWLESFYQEHQGFIEKQLEPVVMALGELAGFNPDLQEAELRDFIRSLARRSIELSQSLLAGVSTDTPEAIDALVESWPGERASRLVLDETLSFSELVEELDHTSPRARPEAATLLCDEIGLEV